MNKLLPDPNTQIKHNVYYSTLRNYQSRQVQACLSDAIYLGPGRHYIAVYLLESVPIRLQLQSPSNMLTFEASSVRFSLSLEQAGAYHLTISSIASECQISSIQVDQLTLVHFDELSQLLENN